METYIGVKMIKAEPCTRGEHSISKGYKKVLEGSADDPGYKVIYPDGYESWSPKEVFEESYFPIDGENKISKGDVDRFMGNGTHQQIDEKTLLVSVESKTGFVQHEAASCVDPKEFDVEIGIEVGMDNLRSKFWGHLGFVLQWAKFGLKK